MSPGGVREYTEVMRARYERAEGRKERGALLDEYCLVTGYHRKAVVRALRRPLGKQRGGRGRQRVYSAAVVGALEQLWEASDRLCSKRLVGVLPELLEALEWHGEVRLEPEVRAAVVRMSAATIDRRLAPKRRSLGRRPFIRSRSATALKALVPLRTFGDWAGVMPGACQADLVAHCDESTEGFYLTTLMMVDVATSWSEFEVVWGKDHLHVSGALHFARRRFPMPVRELHSDNGGEFLNYPLYDYCQRDRILFTRGRPYKKNDQAFVEQKNGGIIRRWVGYDRYSSKRAFELLRRLYTALRPFVNFFQPVQKLIAKQRDGAKVRKQYDQPRTPYQRVMASGILNTAQQQALAAKYLELNPAALRREIDAALDALLREVDTAPRRAVG